MTQFMDLADLEEDRRIRMIGHRTVDHKELVAFIVDDDTICPGKADRYIKKLLEWFPQITVIDKTPGPVKGTTTVRVKLAEEKGTA